MPKFASKWDRPESFELDCDIQDNVERAGYIPVKTQIERLRSAGLDLLAYRAEQFDGDDPEQLLPDPTRNMDKFDVADYMAAADRRLYSLYLEDRKKRAEKKAPKGAENGVEETPDNGVSGEKGAE